MIGPAVTPGLWLGAFLTALLPRLLRYKMRKRIKSGVVTHGFNLSTQEVCGFKASLGYTSRPCCQGWGGRLGIKRGSGACS